MKVVLNILWQSLAISIQEIWGAKLRSFLSLLGITIGILCIISVRTVVSSLKMNIEEGFASFGNNILYVQKMPWLWTEDYPWWKYVNRPSVNKRELAQVAQKVKGAGATCIMYFAGNTNVVADENTAEGVFVMGVSYEYDRIKAMEFTQGRYFTPEEAGNAQAVALIGATVAETLFPGNSQVEGKVIKVNGVKLAIVGVLKSEGNDMFGFTLDNNVIVPYSLMTMFFNMNSMDNDPLIAVVPKKEVPIDELKYELKGAMRSIRRLSPYQEDNFAINNVNVFTENINAFLSIVNMAGLLIGSFSILVGAFGIANIMFVAVKERTYIIGIKKAIGAKKAYILLEFLFEATVLSVLGGIIGLVVVAGLFKLLEIWVGDSGFHFYVTFFNVFLGVSISVVVGVLAGFIPAWFAANMRPVDAIRS